MVLEDFVATNELAIEMLSILLRFLLKVPKRSTIKNDGFRVAHTDCKIAFEL